MEVTGPVNEESARVENVVSEVRPCIRNELSKRYSTQLQSFTNKPECGFGEDLPLAARKSNQFALRRRIRRTWFWKPLLMMMIGICSARLHFSHLLPILATGEKVMLRREGAERTEPLAVGSTS
jgi:hypothetical protein